jgi:rubrerythrin
VPEFASPFSGASREKVLSREELVRSVRFAIAAEYEAVQMYMQLAEATDDALAANLLKEIADEERVHVGEFLRLLKELAHDAEALYAEGAGEVEELMARMHAR